MAALIILAQRLEADFAVLARSEAEASGGTLQVKLKGGETIGREIAPLDAWVVGHVKPLPGTKVG